MHPWPVAGCVAVHGWGVVPPLATMEWMVAQNALEPRVTCFELEWPMTRDYEVCIPSR